MKKLITLLIIVLLAAGGIYGYRFLKEKSTRTYQEAVSAFNDGDYDRAYSLFRDVETHKDAMDYINKIEDYRKFDNALKTYEEKDYTKARDSFVQLNGVRESELYVVLCDYQLMLEDDSMNHNKNVREALDAIKELGNNQNYEYHDLALSSYETIVEGIRQDSASCFSAEEANFYWFNYDLFEKMSGEEIQEEIASINYVSSSGGKWHDRSFSSDGSVKNHVATNPNGTKVYETKTWEVKQNKLYTPYANKITDYEVYRVSKGKYIAVHFSNNTHEIEMMIDKIDNTTPAAGERPATADSPSSSNSNKDTACKLIVDYMYDRYEFYDWLEGEYSGDLHTNDVQKDAAYEFDVDISQVKDCWNEPKYHN